MSQPLLEFREVNVYYGQIQALKSVSLMVNEGETVALIGANGAGKSTLLMSIFGQPRITDGSIIYRGHDISRQSTHYIATNGIAQAPEGRRIFADMTVEENLLMGTIPIGNRYQNEDKARMYQLFPRLAAGDDALRRRAANAGNRPSADEPAKAIAIRRTEPGSGAAGGEADLQRFARVDRPGHDAAAGGAKCAPRAETG
jgi:ABC-type branched-subunit amino acid transport system ATPase component